MSTISKYRGTLGDAFRVIKRVEQGRLSAYVNSVIDPPTVQNPIYTELEDGYVVYPASVSAISISYLRKPAEVVWGYQILSGRPVYDQSASVDPEWNETEINDIIYIACDMMGINLRDGDLLKATEVIKND